MGLIGAAGHGIPLSLPVLDPPDQLFDLEAQGRQAGSGAGGAVAARTPTVRDDHLVAGEGGGGFGVDAARRQIQRARDVLVGKRLGRTRVENDQVRASLLLVAEQVDALAANYPSIKVAPDVLYVDDGRVLTSAGTAAAIDLCLHIVRTDYGAQVANAVARRMVVPPHREGGQAQFIERPVSPMAEADALGPALVWAMEHLDRPQSVPDLARRAAMSPRTFARRFRAEHGTTPHRWLLHQRLLLSRRWLEMGVDSVEDVAERSGFGSAAALRMHFRREFNTSPQSYRRQFGPGPNSAVDGAK